MSCNVSTPRYLIGCGFGRSEYGLCIVNRSFSGAAPSAVPRRAVTASYAHRLSIAMSIARSFSRTPTGP